MSTSLLIFNTDQSLFNQDEIIKIISNMPGVSEIKIGMLRYTFLDCFYTHKDDQSIISISKNLHFVSTSNMGKASLKFIFEFQKLAEKDLFLIDSCYSFEINLSNINSWQDLNNKIIFA